MFIFDFSPLLPVRFTGTSAVERVTGSAGADTIYGMGGNDTLYGCAGNDQLLGGDGNDWLDAGVDGAKLWGEAGDDQLFGGSGADWMDGGTGNDVLTASSGIDDLLGGSGSDVLTGGSGSDRLTGGADRDTFRFDSLPDFDMVYDYVSGYDKICLVQSGIKVGDGDTLVERAVTIAGPGGFSPASELVVVTNNISGSISAAQAARAIGSATSNYAAGQTAVFVVDNGTSSSVFHFKSSAVNAMVSESELTLVTNLMNENCTAVSDYFFAA